MVCPIRYNETYYDDYYDVVTWWVRCYVNMSSYKFEPTGKVAMFDFQDGKGLVPASKHPNGGGWVADSASVASTAYVGPNAKVFGNARVSGYAEVFGNAKVYGDARVSFNARVSGSARVSGYARVFSYAEVSGNAWVCGNAWVYGSAKVYGNAEVFGSARVFDNARVFGNAEVSGNARVSGDAEVSGDTPNPSKPTTQEDVPMTQIIINGVSKGELTKDMTLHYKTIVSELGGKVIIHSDTVLAVET